jgi:hypothetical protein
MPLRPSLVGKELELVLYFFMCANSCGALLACFGEQIAPKKKKKLTCDHFLQLFQPPRNYDFVRCVFFFLLTQKKRPFVTIAVTFDSCL